MRSISVSTDVFAKIWALREPGEDSEDAILRRVLSADGVSKISSSGIVDKRFQVRFPHGFEIFRVFRGTERRARAEAGYWRLAGQDERYVTLNELSRAIGAGTENAWVNWWFLDARGQRQKLDALRNPQTIARRTSSLIIDARDDGNPSEEAHEMYDSTWLKDVADVMRQLHKAPLATIYKEVRRLRTMAGRSRPPSLTAIVRRTLEENSSDSESYKGKEDLFCMPEGKGAGVWALR